MNNVYLDIECIPNQSPEYAASVRENLTAPAKYTKPESIEKWLNENREQAAAEIVAKTSFDPALGHVCTIGYAVGDSKVNALHAEAVEQEAAVIEGFFAELPTLGQNRFIGHYITGFDLRFILNRAIILGVPLPHKTLFPRDTKPWGDETFDTMFAWAGAKGKISQDNLCKALGLETKDGMDGSKVAEAWANGEHEAIITYCKSDVETVRAIHKRFESVGY